jgi:predicted SAM-dependent methyltransferase
MRLHIGSGPVTIPGWTNVDVVAFPGVDMVLDVRQRWPVADVEFVFAEHFLEHLTLADGIAFLRSCRRALRANGVLRLSTPNLDWVWLTHYKRPADMTDDEKLIGCLEMNRAFHGWGHQFLYNLRTLELALRDAGFAEIVSRTYGESTNPELRNLERHERHDDLPGAPSVIIVEASGTSTPSTTLEQRIEPYVRDFAAR